MITIKAVKAARTRLRKDITSSRKWLGENVSGAKAARIRQQLQQMEALERTLTLRVEHEDN